VASRHWQLFKTKFNEPKNMKLKNFILGLAVGIGLAVSAGAQVVDVFNGTRALQVVLPSEFGSGLSPLTNQFVDLVGYAGRGELIVTIATNCPVATTGGGNFNVEVQTSPDTNVWTDISNYAFINGTTAITYTNLYFGSNYWTVDNFLLPGTVTTPSAGTAGFATPYLAPLAFTNTASTNIMANSGTYIYGINLTDSPRYLQVIFRNSTAAKTNTVGVQLIGTRAF
jgi:hypothetical protein